MKANSKVQRLKAKGHKPEAEARSRKSEDGGQKSEDGRRETEGRRPAAVGYLSGFLCVGFALALLVTGCVGHRELLAALERQATRINAVESGLARVDERSKDVTMQPTCRMPEFGHLLLCSLAEANPEGWKISGSWRGTQLPLPATSMQPIRLTREGIPQLADEPASNEARAAGWQRVSQTRRALSYGAHRLLRYFSRLV